MTDQHDPFSDVDDDHGDGGGLAGAGFKRFAGSQSRVDPEGLKVEMCCANCGSGHIVTLEWEELTIAGTNAPGKPPVAPNGWGIDPQQGTLYPTSVICQCGSPLSPHVTPDECRRHVKSALGAAFIGVPQVQGWSQRAESFRNVPQRY